MSKLREGILFLFLGIATVSIGFTSSAKKNAIPNLPDSWRTLDNSYGWSISYPSTWNAGAQSAPEDQTGPEESETVIIDSDKSIPSLLLEISSLPSDLSPQEFLKRRNQTAVIIDEQLTTIDGLHGWRIVRKEKNNRFSGSVAVKRKGPRKDQMFYIDYGSWTEADSTSKKIIDQVVSTFKISR